MKTLLLALLLTSCGSNSGGSSSDQGSAKVERPIGTTTATPVTSYYVSTAKDLKACDDSTRGYLAYVEDVKQFQACLSAGWSVVDVKGKDGAQGTAGTMVSGNQWYDAITTKMWVMSTVYTSTVGWANSNSACGGNYRMPSPTEINNALIHGMKACAQALTSPPTQIIANDGQTYNISNGALNNVGGGAQFCIMN